MKSLKIAHILPLAFILSFCSFSYELLIAKALSDYTGRPLVWQSFTIGAYILGLGIGAYLSDRNQQKFTLLQFFKVEAWLCIAGALSISLITLLNIVYRVYFTHLALEGFIIPFDTNDALNGAWLLPFSLFILGSMAITLFIGVLSGYEVPILINLAKQNGHKAVTHKILGYNAIGTLAAALLFSFYFLPTFELVSTAIIIASINFCVCVYLLSRGRISIKPAATLAGLCIVCLITPLLTAQQLERYNLKTFYYYSLSMLDNPLKNGTFFTYMERTPEVERHTSLYQHIDLVPQPDNRPQTSPWQHIYSMFLDGREQFYSATQDEYHRSMAYIPLNIVSKPAKNVLVLGGGDSLLSHQLLNVDSIEKITHLELDPIMAQLADEHIALTKLNKKPNENTKITRIIGDGFYFLRNTKQKFDVIYIDFPYPDNYDKSRLYSVEFYQYAVNALSNGGVAIIDAPLSTTQDLARVNTFYHPEMKRNNSFILKTAQQIRGHFLPYDAKDDSFILLFNKDGAALKSKAIGLKHYKSFDKHPLIQPDFAHYPFIDDAEYVNSIFKPVVAGVGGFN
jgi:spermidine synthase